MNLSKDKDSKSSSEDEKSKPQPLRVEVLEKVSTLIAAALGFVAAFAWNETFKVIFLSRADLDDQPLLLIGYALFITMIAVVLTIVIARAAAKAKKAIQ